MHEPMDALSLLRDCPLLLIRQLADEEVEAVLAYIKTWWTIEQQAEQADVSKRYQDALDRQKKGQ